MIEKQEKIIITFKTTFDALTMEEVCMDQGMMGRLIPLPKIIDASCGMAYCIDIKYEAEILFLLKDKKLSFQGIYYEWI